MTKLKKADALNLKLKHPSANPVRTDRIAKTEMTLTFPPKQECTASTEYDDKLQRMTTEDQQKWKEIMATYELAAVLTNPRD